MWQIIDWYIHSDHNNYLFENQATLIVLSVLNH